MASSRQRGRKAAVSKPQTNTLFSYIENKGKESKQIAISIIHIILENVDSNCHKRRHTGDSVSKKTMTEWKNKFPWLEFSDKQGQMVMNCNICRKYQVSLQLTNVWSHEGTNNIQMSSITRHRDGIEHKHACEKSAEVDCTENECDDDQNTSSISQNDKILFNTVYYSAYSESPSVQINDLLDLQRMNGLDVKYRNLSWDTISDIQQCISQVLTTHVVNDIKKSDVFAIMLDESTDITVDKRLSVCVRYIKHGEALTTFLCNTHLDDGCAHTVVGGVVSEFRKMGLELSKCTSLATDGAAVMMGKRTGVGKQMQAKHSPFCVQTHCVAHRLNLACVDAIKKMDYLLKFREKFNSLYFFINGSSNRTITLKKIQKLLDEPELTIKEAHSIRWLGLKSAVEAVFECYSSVLATLSKFAEEKNATAKGLCKYFSDYKVLLTVAFMLDVHTELAILSTELQKKNLLLSELEPLIDSTLEKLQSMEETDGQALADIKEKITMKDGDTFYGEDKLTHRSTMDSEFKGLRQGYIKNICKNMRSRFQQEDRQILRDFSQVFDPSLMRADTSTSDDALAHLADFYGSEKSVKVVEGDMQQGYEETVTVVQPILNRTELMNEWPRLRAMMKGAYCNYEFSQVCRTVINVHSSLLPNCGILAKIGLCMTVTSVECERSFSAQNRLKSKYRSSISNAKLDTLLKIKMLGPQMTTFDCSPAVQIWLKKKRRRKSRLTAEFKARPVKIRRVSPEC